MRKLLQVRTDVALTWLKGSGNRGKADAFKRVCEGSKFARAWGQAGYWGA